MLKNYKDYKIINEELDKNNIILEDVICEGLIDNLKNMSKNALAGLTNAANAMTEKFIAGIASIFGKPKSDGTINKIDTNTLSQKLNNNQIIKKIFGDKINVIINSCKNISKDDLMEVMDEEKIKKNIENMPDKSPDKSIQESIFINYKKLYLIFEENEENINLSNFSIEIDPRKR